VAQRTLVIGNKNYSTWSLRPWLALRMAGIAFDEVLVPLYEPTSKAALLRHSPAGKVPVLKDETEDGERLVFESLAICEYAAELAPSAGLWPADAAARAHARSISAEMHAGFAALRSAMPMNLRVKGGRLATPPSAEVQGEIARIGGLLDDARARFGAGGPFLFGGFTIADAMFAPVATRFRTYSIALPTRAQAWSDAVLALPPMLEWERDGLAEQQVFDAYEALLAPS
jgi:glutathione S-transferase